jgi:hypothetical protein
MVYDVASLIADPADEREARWRPCERGRVEVQRRAADGEWLRSKEPLRLLRTCRYREIKSRPMLSLRTCSVRRYRVEGTVPAPASDDFAARLTDRRFRPLSAREERTYGWVTADNLLLTTFDADTMLRGEQVVLAVRIDRRRPNARLLRAQLDLETRARSKAADDGAGPRRLSREERAELKQHLQQELLRQTSPSVEVHTVVYDPRRRLVSMLSLARSANEALCALWQDTFGAALVGLTPWKRAVELLPRAEALDALERTEFWETPSSPSPAGGGELAAGRRFTS